LSPPPLPQLATFYDNASAFVVGNVAAFSVVELCSIARAYSRVSFHSAPLFAAAERALLARKDEVSVRGASSGPAASLVARAGFYPPNHQCPPPSCVWCVVCVVQARDLGSTLAAFANMAPDRCKHLVQGMASVIRDVTPFLSPEELAKAAWTLGSVSVALRAVCMRV
jgi:hypothetical protein